MGTETLARIAVAASALGLVAPIATVFLVAWYTLMGSVVAYNATVALLALALLPAGVLSSITALCLSSYALLSGVAMQSPISRKPAATGLTLAIAGLVLSFLVISQMARGFS